MSWADLIARGSGEVCYILEITGIGVFSTAPVDPTGETWYDDADYPSVSPWLAFDVDEISEQINLSTAELMVQGIRCTITDPSGRMNSLVRDMRSWTRTWLTETLDESDTAHMHVEDTTFFDAAGVVYVRQERIEYTSKTATTFVGLTRGTYGTRDEEHYADTAPPGGIPIMPAVCDGPHSITGRRAILRAAEVEAGSIGDTSVIWRGRVSKGTTVGRGRYQITLEHISDALCDNVGNELPQTTLRRCYWYSGSARADSPSAIRLQWDDDVYHIPVPVGFYYATDLADAIDTALGTHISVSMVSGRAQIRFYNTSTQWGYLTIREGDPLWALGFSPQFITVEDTGTWEAEAEDPPRWCVVDFSPRLSGGFVEAPYVQVVEADGFVAGCRVAPNENRHVEVASISGNFVTLDGMTYDVGGAQPPKMYWSVEEQDDAKFQHVIAFTGSIGDAIEYLLHLDTGQPEPLRWMAHSIYADDVDATEATAVLSGVSPHLSGVDITITEPTSMWEIIGPQLALLGVCPRITDEGRIGMVMISSPIPQSAVSPDLDEHVWSAAHASKAEARLDDAPVLSSIRVKYGLDYTADGDGWRQPLKYHWTEGTITGRTRGQVFECPALWASALTTDELQDEIRTHLVITHFSTMGRETSTVEIPCTSRAKAYRCGDVVSITHELLPDTVEGTIGVTDRLGIVVSRRLRLTGGGVDVIGAKLGPIVNSGGIAPCVLITSDDAAYDGTVADDDLYSDDDLSYFEDGDAVRLIEYNSTSPGQAVATIASIAAGVVTFASMVFGAGGVSAPCWMVPADWNTSDHQTYAYVADLATVPTLGSTPDEAMEWMI